MRVRRVFVGPALLWLRGMAVLLGLLMTEGLYAQAPGPLLIDASEPAPPPQPTAYQPGANVSPTHHVLRLNERYLTMDGKPWLPVMGEFHFSRTPEADWEPELLKMKAAGVEIVATYVFWIHHEEVEGQWNWTGQRDLRHFAELCRKHGLLLYVRLGPWAHGEARNGGFPDWLLTKGPTRRTTPAYMGFVETFWQQVATQLRGELWKDGGPVIGVQLENEYAAHGAGAGEEHILKLKELALALGLDVPLYSVTGWNRAVVPHGAVLPVYGGYPDAPWDASLQPQKPNEVYLFRFGSRVAGNMGMIGASGQTEAGHTAKADTPFLTAEMGGGVEDTYHRRPWLTADDVAAMFPVMLGSGVNWYGTYMFQGGRNPEGQLSTLQESQATHYPSDLPVRSYDFQAPISASGEERPLLRKLKVVNYFLQDFGAQLAPMVTHAPAAVPRGPGDLSVPRVAVRSAGESGFAFVNNHVRGAAMPARPGFQLQVALPGSTLKLPEKPLDLPADAYLIWPFHFDLGGVPLRYSTAQLMARLDVHGTPVFVFFCVRNVRCEFAFDRTAPALTVNGPSAHLQPAADGGVLLTDLKGGLDQLYSMRLGGHMRARLLVITAQQAEDAWKAHFAGADRLFITGADFYASGSELTFESNGQQHVAVQVFPALSRKPVGSVPVAAARGARDVTSLSIDLPHETYAVQVTPLRDAAEVAPAQRSPGTAHGPGNALSPEENGMDGAAVWKVTMTGPASTRDLTDVLLRIRYTGDVAQLHQGTRLLDDNFFNGSAWTVGLHDFGPLQSPGPFLLSIRPMNARSPIFLEPEVRRALPAGDQVLSLDAVDAVPRYRFILRSKP